MEKEVINVVQELNDEIDKLGELSDTFYFVLETDGYNSIVKWLGQELWSSDEDNRDLNEDEEYESLIVFLKREKNRLIDSIVKHKT